VRAQGKLGPGGTCLRRPAAAYVCSCSWATPGLRPKGP